LFVGNRTHYRPHVRLIGRRKTTVAQQSFDRTGLEQKNHPQRTLKTFVQ
jgi:hypothetical protein